MTAAVPGPPQTTQRGGESTKRYRNFIGGEWVASESERSVPNLNPADTRDVLGHMPLSSADETRRAVDAAQAAYPAWRDTRRPCAGRSCSGPRPSWTRRRRTWRAC